MTDKTKLKADKFVNDKKLKLNYIKPKDLKILLSEFCEEQIAELKAECDLAIEGRDVKIKELEAEKKLNAEIKARFVKCNTCTDEMKSKCLMFSENLCEGERCEELVDLMGLISKSELEKENAELKERNAELKGMYAHSAREAGTYKQFLELKEKENAELETRCNELFLQTCEQAEKIKELEEDNKALQTSYNILKDNDEKIIKEMVEQIEKMKCCGNCNGILDGGRRAEKCRRCMDSKKLSEWEIEK